jgi:hypothetical protein
MPTDDRPSDPLPAAEETLDRLRRAGWSVAEYTVRFVSPPALVRFVMGEAGADRRLAAGGPIVVPGPQLWTQRLRG